MYLYEYLSISTPIILCITNLYDCITTQINVSILEYIYSYKCMYPVLYFLINK